MDLHKAASKVDQTDGDSPPLENFYSLSLESQAWIKLHTACKEEHMVICIEITDDSPPSSQRIQPLIVNLAREVSQIPFFRVKFEILHTYDQLREDLGEVRLAPSILIVFFDDDCVRVKKAEGEEGIKMAIQTKALHKTIKDFINQRIKLKIVERFAENFAGPLADLARQRRQSSAEYKLKLKQDQKEEEKLQKNKEGDIEQNLKDKEEKRELNLEKTQETEKQEEEDIELNLEKMHETEKQEARYLGCTSENNCKSLILKSEFDQALFPVCPGNHLSDFSISSNDNRKNEELIYLKRRVKQLIDNVEELDVRRQTLESENDRLLTSLQQHQKFLNQIIMDMSQMKKENQAKSDESNELKLTVEELEYEKDILERKLKNQDELLKLKDQEMRNNQVPRQGVIERPSRIKELEEELLETRMLYACILEDMDILGVIAKQQQGTVVRVKCTKRGLPYPNRVYALKLVANVLATTTMTKARTDFKNEYEILSSLPPHKNIVRLYAFFYDRPKVHPKLRECGDGMALCILMELLSQNMQEQLDVLCRSTGPNAWNVTSWIKDVISGLQYLYSHHIVHRDLKLENLLMSEDGLKIVDFGVAIQLDANMQLPYSFAIPIGGNEAHFAPEILNTRPGPGRVLNYQKQPVWAAGVLSYELAGHCNPFQHPKIDQRAYDVRSLPPLSSTYCRGSARSQVLPSDLTRLVESMLAFEPDGRPTLEEALRRVSRM